MAENPTSFRRMHRSPFDNLGTELKLWRFYGLFDIETDSKKKKVLFKAYTWFYQIVFVYIGFLLQFGTVFNAESMAEAAETLYVSVSYANAVIKILITFWSREKVKRLYDRINVDNYRANGIDEQKYEARNRWHILWKKY